MMRRTKRIGRNSGLKVSLGTCHICLNLSYPFWLLIEHTLKGVTESTKHSPHVTSFVVVVDTQCSVSQS